VNKSVAEQDMYVSELGFIIRKRDLNHVNLRRSISFFKSVDRCYSKIIKIRIPERIFHDEL
jgi:hypothetical protein